MKALLLAAAALLALDLRADTNALTLVKTIPLPDVRGRIDHFAFDAQHQRLFVAALGNDTVEVVDLAAGKRVRTIGDCSEPQGVAFAPAENVLLIANGGSGEVKILDATSFRALHEIKDLSDADNARYADGLFYVGYSDGLAVIRANNGELVANIKLPGHPESFQLEQKGNRIFVNIPDARQVAVIDRDKREVIATWQVEKLEGNFPMALDETDHRLFIGCRRPVPWLFIMDTANGNLVKVHRISGDVDDVFYDAQRKRIYASCGEGFVDVIDQRAGDDYETCGHIATASGARTSFFSPERNELYLAVRAGMVSGKAELRVFKCN